MFSRLSIEADEVDHRIRMEIADHLPKRSIPLGAISIDDCPLHTIPFRRRLIRLATSARDCDNFMSSAHQARNEPRADVTRRANDDDPYFTLQSVARDTLLHAMTS